MSVEKLLLILLFVVISYYPICAIVGFISFIKRNKAESKEIKMSDIELVIKIPEWQYKSICEGVEASKRCGVVGIDPNIHEAIYNGTPLDKHDEEVIAETVESIWGKPPYMDVLDKIKAEIMQLYNEVEVVDYDHNDVSRIKKAHWVTREEVLWIIDKYNSHPKRGADMRESEE